MQKLVVIRDQTEICGAVSPHKMLCCICLLFFCFVSFCFSAPKCADDSKGYN